MPTFIVKPSRDRDFYVAWSTVVEAPIGWGSRNEMLAEYVEERLSRADEFGTSMCDPAIPRSEQWFGWHDSEFICEQLGLLPRDKVEAYCLALQSGDKPAADAMLTPFETEVSS